MEPNDKKVFKAYLRRVRMSPYKIRKVADLIRGLPCDKAASVLEYTHNRGAYFLSSLLKSVMANVTNYNMEHEGADYDVERMFICELRVDEGPRLKRWRAAPMGRAVPILKRTSHITIGITELPPEEKEPEEVEVPAEEKKPRRKRRKAEKAEAAPASEEKAPAVSAEQAAETAEPAVEEKAADAPAVEEKAADTPAEPAAEPSGDDEHKQENEE